SRRAERTPRHRLRGRRRDDRRRAGVRAFRPGTEVGGVDGARRLSDRGRARPPTPHRTRVLRAVGSRRRAGAALIMFTVPLTVALIVGAGLTAGGIAVRSVSRIWLRHWAERQLRGSAAAVSYLERPHRLLTAADAGVALALLVAGMLVGVSTTATSVLRDAL